MSGTLRVGCVECYFCGVVETLRWADDHWLWHPSNVTATAGIWECPKCEADRADNR